MKTMIMLLLFHTVVVWAEKPIIIDPEIEVRGIIQALQKPTKSRSYRDPGGIAEDTLPKITALIHFDFDSAIISDSSLLNKLGQALQSVQLAQSILMIAGHTDSIGDKNYNLALSYQRAEAVKKYLHQQHQITEQRLIIRAYGEQQPIDTNQTEQGRTLNRRVEFIRID